MLSKVQYGQKWSHLIVSQVPAPLVTMWVREPNYLIVDSTGWGLEVKVEELFLDKLHDIALQVKQKE